KNKMKLQEIRYREIGFNSKLKDFNTDVELKITEYKASKGKEFFLEFVNKDDILFGLLRLRFSNTEISELKDCALIREIHIYGKALEIGRNLEGKEIAQHSGLGKRLMAEAEKIAKQNGYRKVAVISGIGVKEYYRKIGYKDEGNYMIKEL
ncbi:MAG: GNAT family N-acetyltransferase, partial [Nanoarchaeota archaeon]